MMARFCLVLLKVLSTSLSFAQLSPAEWVSFMAEQDMTWDSLSTKWEEGVPLGNGLMGVMVYRESANSIRFDLGRTDVVDHREGINPSLGRCRLPVGKFLLNTNSRITKISLRLDLLYAELTGTITTETGTIQLKAIASSAKDVLLFNTTSSVAGLFSWEWKPEQSKSPFATLRDSSGTYQPNPPGKDSVNRDVHFYIQPLLVGGNYTTAWKQLQSGNEQLLAVTIANSYPKGVSQQLAAQSLERLELNNLNAIWSEHRTLSGNIQTRSFIAVPDARLQSFWYTQQYKLTAATSKKDLPIDLMGPWYRITPWPKYWWNLNIQLTYYPVFSSNQVELAMPLLKMVTSHLDNLSNNSPEPYRHNSAALGRSGPYEMTGGIKVVKGNDSTGNGSGSASLELGNLTWLLHVCWQAYEFTQDKKIMEQLFPVLKRSIQYYINIMEKEQDGKYHLPYTYSPEYPKGVTRDANYDLSLLRWGCRTLLFINEALKLNDQVAAQWNDVLRNLTPYPQDQYGLKIGRDASFTLSHRHYSHLLMIYPIHEINWEQPESRSLIKQSLEQWENNNSAWRGYSYSGAASIYATMGNGNKSLQLLNDMFDKGRFAIKPNTMYLEAGPVIETPLSAVTSINEMLLQGWGNIIRVFPAVPDKWKEASFDKLLAQGGFEVSAVRKNGKTVFIRIKSNAGAPCRISTGWTGRIGSKGKRAFDIATKDGITTIDLKKGEEVTLFTGATPEVLSVKPVATDGRRNYWGLHSN